MGRDQTDLMIKRTVVSWIESWIDQAKQIYGDRNPKVAAWGRGWVLTAKDTDKHLGCDRNVLILVLGDGYINVCNCQNILG